MISKKEIKETLEKYRSFLKEHYRVNKIGLFGSFARGEQNQHSDIDLLVDYDPIIGWDVFELREFLEEKLGRKVDLVPTRAIKPQLKDTILREVVYI
ncbi:MAG: nucleotidyltransferase family protein [Candidatus Brocadiae bacterium]|nr:nucleotidyltransferase family protein [Candidatus Brocadiia bacterium]